MNNVELSYVSHNKNLLDKVSEFDKRFFHIENKDCINYKLIEKILVEINPFLNKKSDWLTIGDYNGLEANFLLSNNQIVTASDISDIFLKEAKNRGLINEFKRVNVEDIDYPDNSFDYVLCKEAFHHFPKAYVGLYEMIRVSNKATIMIEPIDILLKMSSVMFMKNLLDVFNPLLINKIWKNRFSFESVGNYVFKISEREVEKIAMGIGIRCIAFKSINMNLDTNLSEDILLEVPHNIHYWRKLNRKISFLNLLRSLHLIPYNHLCSVVFKEIPDENLLVDLKKNGFKVIHLPENPYLKNIT